MKRLCLTILLTALSLSPVMAQGSARDYLSFLPEKDQKTLFASGELTNIADDASGLPLWQKSPFSDKIRAALQGITGTIAAEGFYLIDLPAITRDALDLKIFRSFTAFSTMKGLQVYSVSKGHLETFLFDASLVDPADHSQRLPDPNVESVPSLADYVVYEKEERTGDSYVRFKLEYDASTDVFAISVSNLTDLKYLFFTLVAPGDLHTYFFVVPCQDSLLLYGLTVVKTHHFLGLERTKQKSFYYRMKALVSWFTANVKG
jgi:hypothetical protein